MHTALAHWRRVLRVPSPLAPSSPLYILDLILALLAIAAPPVS